MLSQVSQEEFEQLARSGVAKSVGTAVHKAVVRPRDYKRYVAETVFPGAYHVEDPLRELGFIAMPTPSAVYINLITSAFDGLVTRVNQAISQFLEYDAVLIPVWVGQPFELEVRELSTGFLMFSGAFQPPPQDELTILPYDTWGDTTAPVPIEGSPLRFHNFLFTESASGELEPGVSWSFDGNQLRIAARAGALRPGSEIVLLDADASTPSVRADVSTDGSVALQATGVVEHRYVLAIGGTLAPSTPLELGFSEGLDLEFQGFEVRDGQNTRVTLNPQPIGTSARVRLVPRTHWRAGDSYRLVLGPDLQDGAGNAWGRTLSLRFDIEQGQVLDTYELPEVRDVARLGSWLLVAAGTDGVRVLDAADPTNLRNVLPGDLGFPFPGGDQVMGLDIDPHGRVAVVGGGTSVPGLLKIFDPLAMDLDAIAADPDNLELRNAAFKGSTVISDKLGAIGTQLPAGRPLRVSILSNDQRDTWFAGQPGPQEVTVGPASFGRFIVRVSGHVAAGQNITLNDLDSGASVLVPSMPDGSFGLELEVFTGDLLELAVGDQPVSQWRAGRVPAGPFLVDNSAAPGPQLLTVDGTANANRPVTLKNLTRGSWTRVDSDLTSGDFSVSLEASPGDQLELIQNVDSLAYVATQGAGLEVLDMNLIYNQEPTANALASNVMGIFNGRGEALEVCSEPIDDFSSSLLEIGTLFDASNTHPLTIVGLVGFQGLVLIESNLEAAGEMSALNTQCVVSDGNRNIAGLEVIQDFPFDFNGDGELDESENRDWALVAHRSAGVLVFDVTDRERIEFAGHFEMPVPVAALTIDRESRQLFASAYGSGVYVLDFDAPPEGYPEDRVLEVLELGGNTNAPVLVVPELGLAVAGGLDRGVTTMAVAEPAFHVVAESSSSSADGVLQAFDRLAPLGVPSHDDSPGRFQLQAFLPGVSGQEVTVELVAVGPGGHEIAPLSHPAGFDGLPPSRLEMTLERLASEPWHEGYQLYRSAEVTAVADLRALAGYSVTEFERQACERCGGGEGSFENGFEILSGDRLQVRLTPALQAELLPIYGEDRVERSALELDSVRWEVSPAVRQEPAQSPSFGQGDVAPGTLLHSGEVSNTAVDFTIAGRGLNFALVRTYRSQTLGSGPLGPGWDHNYRQRLRLLPTGDVDHFDGRGRRETFRLQPDGSYVSPIGRYDLLERTAAGYTMLDTEHHLTRFDRHGRLVSIADANKVSPDTGNEMHFFYDPESRLVRVRDSLDRAIDFEYDDHGRLTEVRDFTGRTVRYSYDPSGRLESVRSPAITVGEAVFPDGLTTHYAYSSGSVSLESWLTEADNLISVTDARGMTPIRYTYTDADGDGRDDEVTEQIWGDHGLSLSYDFDARQTEVTDRRGATRIYLHNTAGQLLRWTDPLEHTTVMAYEDDGRLRRIVRPLGRETTLTYDNSSQRSQGNVIEVAETPDTRGSNSSEANACSPAQEAECRQDLQICGCAFVTQSTIAYDDRRNLPVNIIDRRQQVTSVERDDRGLPVRVNRPEDSWTTHEYNDYGQVVKTTNALGHETIYQYFESGPSRGYLQKVTTGGLVTQVYETDALGRVTAITDGRGVRHEQVWNEMGWKVESRWAVSGAGQDAPPLGYTHRYVYDAVGQVIEQQIPYGDSGLESTRSWNVYGVLGELLNSSSEIEPGGGIVSVARSYDENFNLIAHADPLGKLGTFTYDLRNLRIGANLGNGLESETYSYDAEGGLILRADGRGQTWATHYDGKGRLRRDVDPLGHATAYVYNDSDQLTEVRSYDAAGDLLAFHETEFDGLGRLQAQHEHHLESGDVLSTFYRYDRASNLVEEEDAEGRVTRYDYDLAERLIRAEDPAGNVMEFALDANGNRTRERLVQQLPGGGTAPIETHYTFDALDRLTTQTDALGNRQQSTYDARGNLRFSIDAEQHVTVQHWDGLNRLVRAEGPESFAIDYVYDASSNLITYRDALGQETHYTYDDRNRRIGVLYADLTSESMVYDGNGNLTQWTDANGTVVSRVYDESSRMVRLEAILAPGVEGTTLETVEWDGLNRPVRQQSGSVVTELSYDSLSRLQSETTLGREVSYGYTATHAESNRTYPSGLEITKSLDPLDRTLAIQHVGQPSSSTSYTYRGPSSIASQTWSNGVTSVREYDAIERLIGVDLRSSVDESLFSQALTWSPRSLNVGIERGDFAESSRVLAYDGRGRLLEAGQGALSLAANSAPEVSTVADFLEGFSFRYDEADNRLERTIRSAGGADVQPSPPDNSGRNRPAEVDGVPLSWDANGNMIRKGDTHYHYDFRDRLVRVSDATGDLATYEYDVQNRRVRKVAQGQTTEYVWSGWQNLEEYRDGQLVARRTFGLGLDDQVEIERDLDGNGSLETRHVPFFDHTGNLVMLSNADGKPLERYDYSPFGERRILVDSVPPEVAQVRVVGGALWVELSEEVMPASLEAAVQSGGLEWRDEAGQARPIHVHQPVLTGRQARKRLVITTTDPPTPGEASSLHLAAGSLQDPFLNRLAVAYDLPFSWPAGDAVLADQASPEVVRIAVDQGRVVIELSETADLAHAAAAISLDGQPTSWTLRSDGYTLESVTTVSVGSHLLEIEASALDLDGQPLAQVFQLSFDLAPSVASQGLYARVDPREVLTSTASNPYGFHGRPEDAETGLVYFRNRYYDPELGRFISTDPYGYADSPSTYQFALNDPVNNSDPTGELAVVDNIAGGLFSVVVGGLSTCLTVGCGEYSWSDGAIDFGLGFATSGLSSLGKVKRLGALARGSLQAGAEIGLDTGAAYLRHTIDNPGEDYSFTRLAVDSVLNYGISRAGAYAFRSLRAARFYDGPRHRSSSTDSSAGGEFLDASSNRSVSAGTAAAVPGETVGSSRYAAFRNIHGQNLNIYRQVGINPMRSFRLRRAIQESSIGRRVLEAADNHIIELEITGSRIADRGLLGEAFGRNAYVYAFNTQSYSRTAEIAIHEGVHALGVGGSRRAEALARLAEISHRGGTIDRAAMRRVLMDMRGNYDHLRWRVGGSSPHFPGLSF
ncbi:MAG: DUF6531 domain-containing protein [Thermoanaerobaculia bacterium]|nr:DUF6531 domain-containing protein [Thermoanaerobaculia bacterium]